MATDGLSGSDRALLTAFRAICLEEFVVDLQAGDVYVATRDAEALRRLGHNLHSVLTTLSEPEASASAAELEAAALRHDWTVAEADWQVLRAHLVDVQARPSPEVQRWPTRLPPGVSANGRQ